jgi:DNA-binding transcriptional MerR regulator/effector-binding domain-containing protein
MKTPYSIGEFSKITGLSVKTLRFYHEKNLLTPSSVDEATGYRFYDTDKIEKARVIMRLREMQFSLDEIAAMLTGCGDEAEILDYLARQKQSLRLRIQGDRDIVRLLEKIIANEKTARQMLQSASDAVAEKTLEPRWMAGIRMKGKYRDCGQGFSRLGKAAGRYASGPPFCLYYDGEYRDEDADFETCFPLRQEIAADGISVRRLPGGRCLTLVHRGPYDQLGRSYAKILQHASERKTNITLPTREVYLKGPGLIFKGNPRNYLTEIQLPVGG